MRPSERANCREIVETLKEINRRCKDKGYCTDRVSKPQRAGTNLSELTATPLVPLQRTGTNLSELGAPPLVPAFQESMEKYEMPPITEQYSKIRDMEYAIPGKSNGNHSLRKTRRVSTAPELWKSSYNTEQLTHSAPKTITENSYAQEAMDVDEGVDMDVEQDMGPSSSLKTYLDATTDGRNTPPLKTKNYDDSGLGMQFDETLGNLSQSRDNKRAMLEEDAEETTESRFRKRARP